MIKGLGRYFPSPLGLLLSLSIAACLIASGNMVYHDLVERGLSMRSSARLGPSILGYSVSNSEWSQFGQVEWVIFELFLLAPVLLSFVEDLRLPLGYGSAGCRVDSFHRSSD